MHPQCAATGGLCPSTGKLWRDLNTDGKCQRHPDKWKETGKLLGKPEKGCPSNAWLCGCASLMLELIYLQIFWSWQSFFKKEHLQVSRGMQPPFLQAGCEHSSPVPGKVLRLGWVTTFEAQSNSCLNRNLGVSLKNKHKLRKEKERCSVTSPFSSVFPFPWEISAFCGQAHYLLCTRAGCFKPGNELCSSFKSSKGQVFLLIFNTFHLHLLMHTLKYTVSLKKPLSFAC